MAAFLSGQGEIFQGNGSDVLSAAANGASLMVLGTVVPVYSYRLMVGADIKAAADLKGTKIAIQGFGDVTDVATRLALQKVNVDADKDVALGQIPGTSADRAAALIGGAVQGVLVSPPDDLVLQSRASTPCSIWPHSACLQRTNRSLCSATGWRD